MDITKMIQSIRHIIPTAIASQLAGVQPLLPILPMGLVTILRRHDPLFTLAKNQDACLKYPGEHYVVNVKPEVDVWLTDQTCDMWMNTEMEWDDISPFSQYIVSAELYTLMILKWGGQ